MCPFNQCTVKSDCPGATYWNNIHCIPINGVGFCLESCDAGKPCEPGYDKDECVLAQGWKCSEVSGQGADHYCTTPKIYGH